MRDNEVQISAGVWKADAQVIKLDASSTHDQEVVCVCEEVKISVKMTEADGQEDMLFTSSTHDQEVVSGGCETVRYSSKLTEADDSAVKLVASPIKVHEMTGEVSVVTVTISLLMGASELVSSVRDKTKQKPRATLSSRNECRTKRRHTNYL